MCESIDSSNFDIGVLSYYRDGSFPVWISYFKILYDDINRKRNTRKVENMIRLIAPKQYRQNKIQEMIQISKDASGKGKLISSTIVEAMLQKIDGSSSGNYCITVTKKNVQMKFYLPYYLKNLVKMILLMWGISIHAAIQNNLNITHFLMK